MTRPMVIVAVALTAYCVVDFLVSAAALLLWRTRGIARRHLPPAGRARRLVAFRLAPCALAIVTTFAIVLPAFAEYEPFSDRERIGPLLTGLAIVGAAQLVVAIAGAVWTASVTRQLRRQLLREAVGTDTSAGWPMLVVESPVPIVALVGVWRPTLVASRNVVDACDATELHGIIAHERGHLAAHDNLKRWLMTSVPGALCWTSLHAEVLEAWHHAAEDAADDAATGDHPVARADLAALLLKIVRLAPATSWRHAIVSPFVADDHGLERRVRRLVSVEREAPAPLAAVPLIGAVALGAMTVIVLASPAALEAIFDVFEALVAFGR